MHLHWGGFGLVFAGRRTQEYHQHVLATLGDEADFGDLALTKTYAASSWPWTVYRVDFVEKLKPKTTLSKQTSHRPKMWPPSKVRNSTTLQSLSCRCFSEAVSVRGKSMQAAKPCPQEEPLKEVLLTLGFKESELTDLHNMEYDGEKAVEWRLFCRVATLSIVFAVIFRG